MPWLPANWSLYKFELNHPHTFSLYSAITMRSVAILFVVTNFAFSSACLHGLLYGDVPADNAHCNVTYINGDVTVTDACNGYCHCDWLKEVRRNFSVNGDFYYDYDSGNMRIRTGWRLDNLKNTTQRSTP